MLLAPPDKPDPSESALDLEDPLNREIIGGHDGIQDIADALSVIRGTESLHHDQNFGYIIRYKTGVSEPTGDAVYGTAVFWSRDRQKWMIATYSDFEFRLD